MKGVPEGSCYWLETCICGVIAVLPGEAFTPASPATGEVTRRQ